MANRTKQPEHYLPIPGYSDYEVSRDGVVRRIPRLLKPFVQPDRGYAVVSLSTGSRPHTRKLLGVHRAVALAHLGPSPAPSFVVRHLNGRPPDNYIENLAWGTHADNWADRRGYIETHPGAEETWATVTGFELYEASTQGRVRRKAIIRKPKKEKSGYLRVGLTSNKNQSFFSVHRLVLLAHGPRLPFSRAQCRHKNGIRDDNRIENLCWGTAKDNAADRGKHGTTQRGEAHYSSKVTVESAKQILNEIKAGSTYSQIKKKFSIGGSTLAKIATGKHWTTREDGPLEPAKEKYSRRYSST